MARRCLVEGCGKFVRAGRAVCQQHARTPLGRIVLDELRGLERELGELAAAGEGVASRRAAVRLFRQRVEQGEYAALFAGRMREVLGDGQPPQGFEEEVAALRATLWRLLADERIAAAPLAHAVSRVVGETVRATKLQQRMGTTDVATVKGQLAAWVELLGRATAGESRSDGPGEGMEAG